VQLLDEIMGTRMRGGNDEEHSISMPSWMVDDAPSEDEDEVHSPNIDPEAEHPINDQEDDHHEAGHQGGPGMQAGQQPATPVQQLGAVLNQAHNPPGLVQHPAQQQRQIQMPTSGYPFLSYAKHGVQLQKHNS
jgi:hypothetical protein